MSVSNDWMNNPLRGCKDEPLDTFITPGDGDDEPHYPSPRAKAICVMCEVRPECLAYAFEHNIEFGVWGGMSTYQRHLMTKKQERKKCIACPSNDIIVENRHEVCLACGTSWPIW